MFHGRRDWHAGVGRQECTLAKVVFLARVVLGRGMSRLIAGLVLVLALPASAGERLAGRAKVIDGDTIVVDGIHVRLKGVAAPEVAHFGRGGEPGGEEAR